MRALAAAGMLLFALAAIAAGGTPTAVELTIVGGPNLNPNAQGRASPVVVRLYDLRAPEAFYASDYGTLFERAREALGADLLGQEEFVLRPGDIQHHDRSEDPQVRVLGVAAAFRELDRPAWRLAIPIRPGVRNQLLIDLDGMTVRQALVDPGHS